MKNKILTFSFLIITLFLPLLAQYEWSEPVMLGPKVTFPDSGYRAPTITVDENGVIHAFLVNSFDNFGDNYDQIFYRKSNDGGTDWTEAENLTPDYFSSYVSNLSVLCDSENNLHLMFMRGSKVMHMKYDGISWTEPVSIYDYATSNLRVAIDGNDRIYAVWYSGTALFSYMEGAVWSTPSPISETYSPGIISLEVCKDNNVYACGSVGGINNRPFICRYERDLEEWNNFLQIPGFEEKSWASCMTFSKNDTLNVNIVVGPTTRDNINYNVKYCVIDAIWSTPQYVNENTELEGKDFYRDYDNNLHLFEFSYDDSSVTHIIYNNGNWNELIFPCEPDNSLQVQDAFFDGNDTFYLIYRKNYHATNERAVFFQKKQIEVGIENNDEVIIKDCKLYQNYPNPFNNETEICYSLSYPALVQLNVLNLNGQLVQTIVNEKRDKGFHKTNFDANSLSTGLYFYNLKVDGIVKDTKKMLYLR
jgi:hypothetical protein